VQRGHAALAFGIHLCESLLGYRHRLVVQAADQIIGSGPGLFFRLAHNHMQADAITDCP